MSAVGIEVVLLDVGGVIVPSADPSAWRWWARDWAWVRVNWPPCSTNGSHGMPSPRGTALETAAQAIANAAEIASSSQYRPEMGAKAWLWLQRGTRMVWVVWPRRQEVDVWTPQREEPSTLRMGDQIDGGDVLPGFTLPVAELFGPR